MVQRPIIPHFLAKVMDSKNLEGQGRGSVKDLPRPFFLKSTLFTNCAPELSLIVLWICPSRFILSIFRAFKWYILSLCSMCSFGENWRKPQIGDRAFGYICWAVYVETWGYAVFWCLYVISHITLFSKNTDHSCPPNQHCVRPYCIEKRHCH